MKELQMICSAAKTCSEAKGCPYAVPHDADFNCQTCCIGSAVCVPVESEGK